MEHPSSTPQRVETELSRDLGLTTALAIGVGTMIAAGIFTLSGLAIRNVGSAAIVAFLLAAIVASFTALVYCEFVSIYPRTGEGCLFGSLPILEKRYRKTSVIRGLADGFIHAFIGFFRKHDLPQMIAIASETSSSSGQEITPHPRKAVIIISEFIPVADKVVVPGHEGTIIVRTEIMPVLNNQ